VKDAGGHKKKQAKWWRKKKKKGRGLGKNSSTFRGGMAMETQSE